MPIFEYRCKECDRRFEAILQGAMRASCPACGTRKLEKQLSVFAVAGTSDSGAAEPAGSCGSCGDPRGPGSCALD